MINIFSKSPKHSTDHTYALKRRHRLSNLWNLAKFHFFLIRRFRANLQICLSKRNQLVLRRFWRLVYSFLCRKFCNLEIIFLHRPKSHRNYNQYPAKFLADAVYLPNLLNRNGRCHHTLFPCRQYHLKSRVVVAIHIGFVLHYSYFL